MRGRVKVRYQAGMLAENYDAIHGHFLASKYLALGERAALCAFFRDPLDRLISQYRYWSDNPDPDNAMWVKFNAERLSLRQFASLPRQRKLYKLFTAGLPMDRFCFVGLTEEYETSLDLFRAIFGIAIQYRRVNVGDKASGQFDNLDRDAIISAQRANYSIYDAARRRFDALCMQHLRS